MGLVFYTYPKVKPQLNRYFEIVKETPLEGGSVQWEVEYSEDFKELYKKATGKKRVHEKSLSKWFVNMIVKGLATKNEN